MARRAKADLETELKRIEEEAQAKTRQAEEIREKIKQTRVDDFIKWCKRHDMDAMQFFKLAILDDWGAEIKAIYSKMTAEPVGVIKSSKPVQESVKIEKDKVVHSESEDDDNQTEVDSDDDEDDSLSDSDDDYDDDIDEDEDDSIDEDIDSENEEDDGQQKLWS